MVYGFSKAPPEADQCVCISHHIDGVSSYGGTRHGVTVNHSLIEERVADLERQIPELRREAQQHRDHETRDRKAEIESERKAREADIEKTRKLLEESAAGGLMLELTGVYWLLLGVFFSTVSVEIPNWLSSLAALLHHSFKVI